jgi:hypothetical protein
VVSFTPQPLYPRGNSSRYPLDRRLDPRTGLNDMEKRNFLTLPGLELRPLCRPARGQSLYRLSYPGSLAVDMGYLLKIYRNITLPSIPKSGSWLSTQGISGFLDFIHRPVFEGTRHFGNWICFRPQVTMGKSRNPDIPCVIHHRHNPSETDWVLFNKSRNRNNAVLLVPIRIPNREHNRCILNGYFHNGIASVMRHLYTVYILILG